MSKKLLSLLFILLVALGCISIAIADKHKISKNNPELAINLTTALPELKDGDLIFRKGRSMISRIVLMNDTKTDYSHIGIVAILENVPFVIHAVPGEPNEKGEELVKCDLPENFLSFEKASKFAVYRLKEDSVRCSYFAAQKALEFYYAKLPFDKAMNFRTDDKLYCTELVWKAYLSAGINITDNKFHLINFSLFTDSLIMPSQIIENMSLMQIYP